MKVGIELPVQFRDIYRMGHVNHAVYLQYMETARVKPARILGMIRDMSSSSFIVATSRRVQETDPGTSLMWLYRVG